MSKFIEREMKDMLDRLQREIERLQRENEQLRKELADKIYLLAKSSADIAALKASTEPDKFLSEQHGLPVYLAPPTATALVEDFRKRAVEVVMENWLNLDRTTKVDMKVAIESLPLIEEKK